jgi:CheY-like chemotaxis protein
MLRDTNNHFDLVLSDVVMPGILSAPHAVSACPRNVGTAHQLYLADVDGFKLLEIIGLEMDIPVISTPSQAACKRARLMPLGAAKQRPAASLMWSLLWLWPVGAPAQQQSRGALLQ